MTRRASAEPIADTLAPMSYDPSSRSIPELVGDFAAVMREPCARKVARTRNNPIGDVARVLHHADRSWRAGHRHVSGYRPGARPGQRVALPAGHPQRLERLQLRVCLDALSDDVRLRRAFGGRMDRSAGSERVIVAPRGRGV